MRTIYETNRLILQVLDNTAAVPVLSFYSEGRQTFEPVEADKNPNFYTLDYQSACLYAEYSAFMHGTYMRYFWKLKDAPDTIIGTASFIKSLSGIFFSRSCTSVVPPSSASSTCSYNVRPLSQDLSVTAYKISCSLLMFIINLHKKCRDPTESLHTNYIVIVYNHTTLALSKSAYGSDLSPLSASTPSCITISNYTSI